MYFRCKEFVQPIRIHKYLHSRVRGRAHPAYIVVSVSAVVNLNVKNTHIKYLISNVKFQKFCKTSIAWRKQAKDCECNRINIGSQFVMPRVNMRL